MNNKTQEEAVLEALKKGKTITPLDALEFIDDAGCRHRHTQGGAPSFNARCAYCARRNAHRIGNCDGCGAPL